MDIFSHVLWTRVITRNKLWDEEALLFSILPDTGSLLIMLYVIFGKPMGQDFTDAMTTLPASFLYPILPDFYIHGLSWGDYRVLAASYFLLLVAWYYLEMRELKKHRSRSWSADWLDRLERFIGNQINPQPIPAGHAESGDHARASGQVPGEDRERVEKGENNCAGTVPPPQAG